MADPKEQGRKTSTPEPYRPQAQAPAPPVVADPTLSGNEFAADDAERQRRRERRFQPKLPVFGDTSKPAWNVMVRHSTFYLKQATIHADTPEEAQRVFLDAAKQRHQQLADRQKGPNVDKDRERVWGAYQHGLQNQLGGWVIRPAEQAKVEREYIRDRTRRRWAKDEETEHAKAAVV